MEDKLSKAFALFDKANAADPNFEIYQGKTYPKELLYAFRMTERLNKFEPSASESLKLTARCQHICRWEIPRASYPMDRPGYLKWRQDLKKFHAEKAGQILQEVGYSLEITEMVAFLLEKKQLKKNPETQTLEDVICLVFLEFYFEPFSKKYDEEKLIDIIQKTWRKMSDRGQKVALELPLPAPALTLIQKALQS